MFQHLRSLRSCSTHSALVARVATTMIVVRSRPRPCYSALPCWSWDVFFVDVVVEVRNKYFRQRTAGLILSRGDGPSISRSTSRPFTIDARTSRCSIRKK